MKVFSTEYISRELIEEIRKEKNVYYSKEWDMFIMTDKVFKMLDGKYSLLTMKDEDEELMIEFYFNSIKELMNCMYEQVTVKFFDRDYYLREVAEDVEQEIEFRSNEETGEISVFTSDDWKDDLKRITMERLTIIIRSDLEDELIKLTAEGGNLSTMKEAIQSIEHRNK